MNKKYSDTTGKLWINIGVGVGVFVGLVLGVCAGVTVNVGVTLASMFVHGVGVA